MKIQAKNIIENYIQCYAPLNSDEGDVKDEFFENLHDTLADIPSTEQIYPMGHFNGKVGNERRMYTDYLGPHGRGTRNDNGERLLEICASHNLGTSNTFFQHQDSHAYTWYKWGDQRIRSQIDYIITRRKEMRNIMDTRVIPSENVSTDHRMVVATIRKETRRNRMGRTFQRRSVNVKKLMKPDINRKYQEEISYKLALLPNKLNSAEKEWIDFKDIIQGTAEKMVGQKKCGGQQKKATAWWNEETRQATKLKKQLYKKWLKDPTPQNKEQYQSARDACKQVIKQAKEKAWSEYSNQLEGMRKTEAMKSFYKKVKSMRERDQPYCPITTIKDVHGQIITDTHQVKQRWGGYFEGLLNPNEDPRDNNFSAQDILEHEPEILRSEVEESLKSANTGKAPGIDRISIEIIKAAGEAGVELLWRVCRAVWKDGTAPTEWRQSIIIPIWKRKETEENALSIGV